MDAEPVKKHRRSKKRKKIETLQIPELPTERADAESTGSDIDPEFAEIIARFDPHIQKSEEAPEIQEQEDGDIPEPEVSHQQVRKYGRPTIAGLKSISRRPELIEPNDVDAPDPFTLVEIKHVRNVVRVPSHWSQKRKYLNYKRGSEISRYRLPAYLESTGIGKMRQSVREADDRKSLQQRQRDRAKPKLGLIDIPEALLIDAFWRQQTKPIMTRFGDMYFENKELMPSSRNLRPGKLSQKLREALGMVENSPPPWLFRMQKLGPPPSYPNLKIPGLNAPLPPGCEWGSHHGGWGQVPLNENGEPVWGGNPFAKVEEVQEERIEMWGVMERGDGVQDGVNI